MLQPIAAETERKHITVSFFNLQGNIQALVVDVMSKPMHTQLAFKRATQTPLN